MLSRLLFSTVLLVWFLHNDGVLHAADWPMWRADAARTGATSEPMPRELRVLWKRRLAPLTPAYRSARLQFDSNYEPVVSQGVVVVSSSAEDCVSAFDVETGKLRWRVAADGPVRCAPVIWKDRVFFGADDGQLYTVSLADGALIRRQRLAVGPRMVLGNGRLISVWPVRGGAVVADDRLYVACGVWPSEGVFVYCFDAATGKEVWHNDRLGYLFGGHPHNAEAFGGLAPQGYLLVNGEELVAPCSTAYPARLRRDTGELVEFELPLPGRKPGGWFASLDPKTARDVRRGELQFDREVNQQEHEDGPRHSGNVTGVRHQIVCDGKSFEFSTPLPGIDQDVRSVVVANSRVLATTDDWMYCLAPAPSKSNPKNPKSPITYDRPQPSDDAATFTSPSGYLLAIGTASLAAVKQDPALLERQWIIIEPDESKSNFQRDAWRMRGYRTAQRAIINRPLNDLTLPPYFASEVVSGHCDESVLGAMPMLLKCLRPFGGVLRVRASVEQNRRLTQLAAKHKEAVLEVERRDDWTVITKPAALQGAADYVGEWKEARDSLVRAPLGVLWYDDELAHFKRSPQPKIIAGIMVSYPKDWHAPRVNSRGTDYPLLSPVFSDIYTGRVLRREDAPEIQKDFPEPDAAKREPSQYRPPRQKDDWKPSQPKSGVRTNPLNGKEEARVFPKSYGCDGGVDYGYLFSMRSGTAAFYDKTLESGTICVSGPRSGCTNSIIPAGGLLNVPYFYEGCTCSYPLPCGLALYSLPEAYEQWASWGDGDAADIQRVGVNFGAPGDRMTRDGTLWLEHPSVGGASPQLEIRTSPQSVEYRYQHSLRITQGEGWPWVAASEATGIESVELKGLKSGSYLVRLYFSDVNHAVDEESTVQEVTVQGKSNKVRIALDSSAGNSFSRVAAFDEVQVGDGTLRMDLRAIAGRTRLSGIEAIRSDLKTGGLHQIGVAKEGR